MTKYCGVAALSVLVPFSIWS